MIDYQAGYQAAGELDNGLDALRWGADWILKVVNTQCTENIATT